MSKSVAQLEAELAELRSAHYALQSQHAVLQDLHLETQREVSRVRDILDPLMPDQAQWHLHAAVLTGLRRAYRHEINPSATE